MSKKFYFSRRAASGGGKDLSCGYESGDILAGDSDDDVCNQYSAESEGIMHLSMPSPTPPSTG